MRVAQKLHQVTTASCDQSTTRSLRVVPLRPYRNRQLTAEILGHAKTLDHTAEVVSRLPVQLNSRLLVVIHAIECRRHRPAAPLILRFRARHMPPHHSGRIATQLVHVLGVKGVVALMMYRPKRIAVARSIARMQFLTKGRSMSDPTRCVNGELSRSRPNASCSEHCTVRINASPRCPALPVTRIFIPLGAPLRNADFLSTNRG